MVRTSYALLFGFLLVGAATAQSEGAPAGEAKAPPRQKARFADPAAAARDYLAAFRAHDEPAMQRQVDTAPIEQLDWFRVAHEFLFLHARSADGAADRDGLDAAESLATRVAHLPQGEGLSDLVASWRRFTPDDHARERRLGEAQARLGAAFDKGPSTALAVAAEVSAEVEAAPDSCVAAMLRFQIGLAQYIGGRLEAAANALTAAAAVATRLRWQYGRAEILVMRARVERQRGNPDRALELMTEERDLREKLGHPRRLADLLLSLGEEHCARGTLEAALSCYTAARAQFETLEDRAKSASAWSGLGLVHEVRLQWEAAVDCYRESLARYEAVGDAARAIQVKGALGLALVELGQEHEGLGLLEATAGAAEATKSPGLISRIHTRVADAQRRLGRWPAAMEHYTRARDAALAADLRPIAAGNLTNIGMCLGELGRYAEAIDITERGVAEFESCGRRMNAAEALAQLATLRLRLRDYAGTIAADERAIGHVEALGEDRVLGAASYDLGIACYHIGEYGRALAALERARATYTKQGETRRAAGILVPIGKVYTLLGRLDHALEVLAGAEEHLRSIGDRAGAAYAVRALAHLHVARGDHAPALRLLEQASSEFAALGEDVALADALEAQATAGLELDCSHARGALVAARQAMDTWTRLGRDLTDVDALSVSEQNAGSADAGLAAAHRWARCGGGTVEQALADALWFVESGRGRILVGGLVNRSALLAATLSPELCELEASTRNALHRAQTALVTVLARSGAATEDVEAARARLASAYLALESATARTQREARRVADLVHPQPVDLAALRAALQPDEVVLLYQTGASHTFVVVIGKESGATYDLGATAALMEKVVSFGELVSVPGTDEEGAAARLYETLLRPLEDRLASARRLLVSPDGALTFLPFEALVRRDGSARERALERWEMVYVPSATVLVTLRAEAARGGRGEGLLALGDPVYPGEDVDAAHGANRDADLRGLGRLRRLRGSGDEVRAIAELFAADRRTLLVRGDASLTRLERALAEAPRRLAAVHFACHGHVDVERPRLTGLVLAGGEVLTLDRLYRQRIEADLAVLSACETARGRVCRGEGVVGLVRGFFFAGCPRLIVSDWRVDDEGTRALMTDFYRLLVTEERAPAAALRAAKLARLRSTPPAHPSSWAAFVAWGLPE